MAASQGAHALDQAISTLETLHRQSRNLKWLEQNRVAFTAELRTLDASVAEASKHVSAELGNKMEDACVFVGNKAQDFYDFVEERYGSDTYYEQRGQVARGLQQSLRQAKEYFLRIRGSVPRSSDLKSDAHDVVTLPITEAG
ncbi:hypothetical protein ACIBF7_39860 [Nonomuraea sp. NPDC050478]|uniref:hypothetical protein n=1 Tax=Nonomuraea sp. NPDC050478 TaxID=3364365 RepID=UPI0037B28D10